MYTKSPNCELNMDTLWYIIESENQSRPLSMLLSAQYKAWAVAEETMILTG